MVLKLNGLDPSYGSDIQNVFPYGWSLVKVTVRTVCIFKPFINELFTVWLAGFFRYCILSTTVPRGSASLWGDLIQTTKSPITISVLRMIRVSKPSCTGSTSRVFRVNHSWLVSAVGIGGNNNASGPGGLLPAPTLLSSTLGQYWTAIFVVDFINYS